VNRIPCFVDDADREFYLSSLRQAIKKHPCQIHAYVLMTNHVHMLVTGEEIGFVSAMMQSLGRRYVRYFNTRHQRTGTLWEGRFKSNLVDSDEYILTCYRYIEMNPVRAGIVDNPYDYRWSSVHANAKGVRDPLLSPHPTYQSLGSELCQSDARYQAFLFQVAGPKETKAIRDHVNQGKPIGSAKFKNKVADLMGRGVNLVPIGRPKKLKARKEIKSHPVFNKLT